MNIILTGGHTGMGLELSKMLLSDGHKIGLIVRNEKRKQEVIASLPKDSKVEFFFADLSKRNEIERVATDIAESWSKIDMLFNNAGILADQLYFAESGNELQLEINGIAPYLLTKSLLPLLGEGANQTVVNTATGGLNHKKDFDIATFKKPTKFKKLIGSYMDSKLILVMLMNSLSRKEKGIRFVSVNPGAIKTKMTAGEGMPGWLKPLRNLLFKSPEKGGQSLYNAGFSEKVKGTGIYINGGKSRSMKVEISDDQIEELLSN